jgi:hypothetical protein
MKQVTLNSKLDLTARVAIFVTAGYTQNLVKDDTRQAIAVAKLIFTKGNRVARQGQGYHGTPGINTQAVSCATQIIRA